MNIRKRIKICHRRILYPYQIFFSYRMWKQNLFRPQLRKNTLKIVLKIGRIIYIPCVMCNFTAERTRNETMRQFRRISQFPYNCIQQTNIILLTSYYIKTKIKRPCIINIIIIYVNSIVYWKKIFCLKFSKINLHIVMCFYLNLLKNIKINNKYPAFQICIFFLHNI